MEYLVEHHKDDKYVFHFYGRLKELSGIVKLLEVTSTDLNFIRNVTLANKNKEQIDFDFNAMYYNLADLVEFLRYYHINWEVILNFNYQINQEIENA
jgi:hypothetical protein